MGVFVMNIKKCEKGHYFDFDEHNVCPFCGGSKSQISVQDSVHSFNDTEAFIQIKGYGIKCKLYCCVFHHLLRSAIITPLRYPVDYISVVSNGEFEGKSNLFTDGNSQIKIHIMMSGQQQGSTMNKIFTEAKLDSKVALVLPICDAMESWDVIFSHKPIVPEQYLDGYSYRQGNVWARTKDLLEQDKRNKEAGDFNSVKRVDTVVKEELVSCFQDTLSFSNNGKLIKATTAAINSNKVYKEGFVSNKKESYSKECFVEVNSTTTFSEAKRNIYLGKVAVLNFANPHNPGGGVQNGAMAQEECLCRSSNLYSCISAENVFNNYYLYNRNIGHLFFSDRLIYTKNVTVFKTDDTIPQMMLENEWFSVDVITCAAPYIAKRKHTNIEALKQLFKSRIKNIFESAIDNDVDVLILGAFGCGAFKNPPGLVAESFFEVIEENQYRKKFKKIVFAIKPTTRISVDCPNYSAFMTCAEENNECTLPTNNIGEKTSIPAYTLPSNRIIEELVYKHNGWGFRYELTPKFVKEVVIGKDKYSGNEFFYGEIPSEEIDRIIERKNKEIITYGIENQFYKFDVEAVAFWKWQVNNRYYGKNFSILGDSISTLDGFNPNGYNFFYTGENCIKSGVSNMSDTWWGKVTEFFGGDLLVNNSWADSRVTKSPDRDEPFPSGCSDKRTSSLHINNVMPDVVIVYLGTNDWVKGVKIDSEETQLLMPVHSDCFCEAYEIMIQKLKENYPKSEIWCCTLGSTFMSNNSNFEFPKMYGGKDIDEYNQIIKNTASKMDCKIIDIAKYDIPFDTVDGSHPTKDGMSTIATAVIRETDEYASEFLSCKDSRHDYKCIEKSENLKTLCCKKCLEMIEDDMTIGKCIEKDSNKRYQSVEELLHVRNNARSTHKGLFRNLFHK